MRLRLRCSSAYKLGDLQWCMVHVPEHLRTVQDLALHISNLLELNSRRAGASGTEPPQLMLEGFLVPHDEEVRAVLRDDEVVDVEPSVPTPQGLLPLAAQAAWSSPAASGKRPLGQDSASSGAAAGKRHRGGKGAPAAPAAMAIGWQSPDVSSKASAAPPPAPAAAAAAATEESSSDSSGEEDAPPRGESKLKAGASKAVLPKSAAAAGEAARRAALATCDSGSNGAVASAGSDDKGIFVGGIGQSLDDDQLRQFFQQYGEVASASVVLNNHTQKPKGYAFVDFVDAAGRNKALAAGPKLELAGKTVEVKPRIAKAAGKGHDAKGNDGKSKSGKKGGEGSGKSKGTGKSKSKAAPAAQESNSSEEESSEEEVPKKVPAPGAKTAPVSAPALQQKKAAKAAPVSSEELEVQRQMAALGLPVSFTASEMPGGDSDDDDEDEEEEEGEA